MTPPWFKLKTKQDKTQLTSQTLRAVDFDFFSDGIWFFCEPIEKSLWRVVGPTGIFPIDGNTDMKVFNGSQEETIARLFIRVTKQLRHLRWLSCWPPLPGWVLVQGEGTHFPAEGQESDTKPEAVGIVAVSKLSRSVAQDWQVSRFRMAALEELALGQRGKVETTFFLHGGFSLAKPDRGSFVSFPHLVLSTWYESQEGALYGCFVSITRHLCSWAGEVTVVPRGVS